MAVPEALKTRSAQLAVREERLRSLLGPDTINTFKDNIATRVATRMSKDAEEKSLSASDQLAKLPEINARVKDFQTTLDFNASRVMAGLHKVHLKVVNEQKAHEEELEEPRKPLEDARKLGIPDTIVEKAQEGFDETYDAPFVQAPLSERRAQAIEKARVAREAEKGSSTPPERPADRVNHAAVEKAAEILTGTRSATSGETIVLSRPASAEPTTPVTAPTEAPAVITTPPPPAERPVTITLSPPASVPVPLRPVATPRTDLPPTTPAPRYTSGVVRLTPDTPARAFVAPSAPARTAEPERKVTRKFTKGDAEAAEMLVQGTEVVTLQDLKAMMSTSGEDISYGSLRDRILDRLDSWVAHVANAGVSRNSKEGQIATELAHKFGVGVNDFNSIRREARGRFGILLDTLHTHEVTAPQQRGLHAFLNNPHDVTPDVLQAAIKGDSPEEISADLARETLLTAAKNTVEQALAYHIVGVNPHPHLRWDDMAGVSVVGKDMFEEVYSGVVRRVNLAFGIDPTAPDAPAAAAEFMSDKYLSDLRKRIMAAAKPGDRWTLNVGEARPTAAQPDSDERYGYLDAIRNLPDSQNGVYKVAFSGGETKVYKEKQQAQVLQALLLARDHHEGLDIDTIAQMIDRPVYQVVGVIRSTFRMIPEGVFILDAETGGNLTADTRVFGIRERNKPVRFITAQTDSPVPLQRGTEVEVEAPPFRSTEVIERELSRTLAEKLGQRTGNITFQETSRILGIPAEELQEALRFTHTQPKSKGNRNTHPNQWTYTPDDIAVALLTRVHQGKYSTLGMIEQVEFRDAISRRYDEEKKEIAKRS